MKKTLITLLIILAVVLFAGLIFFYDGERDRLDFFIGGEPAAAGIAQPSAADGIRILNRSGIHYPCIFA